MKEMKNDGVLIGMSKEEIAFFVVFKMPSCLASTRRQIKLELRDLGMDVNRAKALVASTKFTYPPDGHGCPRCGSTKRYRSLNGNGPGSAAHDSDGDMIGRCLVCDYGPEDSMANRSVGKLIARWLRVNKR